MSMHLVSLVLHRAPYQGGPYLALMALAWWSNEEGVCWPSMAALALRARQSERNVRHSLRQLEADGVLTTEEHRGRGHQNRYQLNVALIERWPVLGDDSAENRQPFPILVTENRQPKPDIESQNRQPAQKTGQLQPQNRIIATCTDPSVDPSVDPSGVPPRVSARDEKILAAPGGKNGPRPAVPHLWEPLPPATAPPPAVPHPTARSPGPPARPTPSPAPSWGQHVDRHAAACRLCDAHGLVDILMPGLRDGELVPSTVKCPHNEARLTALCLAKGYTLRRPEVDVCETPTPHPP